MGILKSKIAKLRTQLLEPEKGPGSEATGFEVVKYGDARIALIGFPSVGKSTALSLLTGTESEAANYEFTTLTCIPGIIHYKGTKMQLLDLPGIIEGAANGKGRGRQVIAVAKSADLVLMMLGMCVAVCCSVLQCVAVCCRVCALLLCAYLACVRICSCFDGLQCVAVCCSVSCSVLRYVVVCCSVCALLLYVYLACVRRYSVLQCVAVC